MEESACCTHPSIAADYAPDCPAFCDNCGHCGTCPGACPTAAAWARRYASVRVDAGMKQAVGAGAGASGGDRRPLDKSDSVGDDAGGGGGIDDLCGGFAAMMCGGDTRGYGSKREALEKAFDKYDENKDGYLTQGELTTWLNAVFDMSYRKDTGLRARIGTDPLSLARATAEVRRGATRVEVWRRGAALKAKRVAVGAARRTSGAWAKRRVCEAARVRSGACAKRRVCAKFQDPTHCALHMLILCMSSRLRVCLYVSMCVRLRVSVCHMCVCVCLRCVSSGRL